VAVQQLLEVNKIKNILIFDFQKVHLMGNPQFRKKAPENFDTLILYYYLVGNPQFSS